MKWPREEPILATRQRIHWPGCISIALGLAIVLMTLPACGGGGDEKIQFQKVTPSDRSYELEDFQAIGFKKSKEYDVTGLPGGVDAYMGFFGPDPYNRKQYELRFYASHEDAVEQGTGPANEVTGEDAEKYRLNPTWEEGRRDRWIAGNAASGGQMPSDARPKYGDFAIYGNVLMLCEGAVVAEALELCESLVTSLVGSGSE